MKNNAIKFKNKRERDSKVANKALDKLYGFEFGKVNIQIDSEPKEVVGDDGKPAYKYDVHVVGAENNNYNAILAQREFERNNVLNAPITKGCIFVDLAKPDTRSFTGYILVDENGDKHVVSRNEYDRLCAFHGL